MPRVLVVGAGPTGALCSYILRKELKNTVHIDVWEKSSGSGGRMNTTCDHQNPECTADLGAQYFTITPQYARDHRCYHSELLAHGLTKQLSGGIEGIVNSVHPPGTKHYVTPNGISSVVKYFLKKSGAKSLFNRQLINLQLHGEGLSAKLHPECDNSSNGSSSSSGAETIHPPSNYDAVILTMPIPEVLQLKGLVAEKLEQNPCIHKRLKGVLYSCRYALALFYPPGVAPDLSWNARYEKEDSCIRWISIDNRKRYNDKACTALVVHTSVPFGIKYLNTDESEVEPIIRQHLDQLIPNLPLPVRTMCKRWRYSQVSKPYEGSPGTVVVDDGLSHMVLLAGDGLSHSNLDGCIHSAEATCNVLLEHWTKTSQIKTEY